MININTVYIFAFVLIFIIIFSFGLIRIRRYDNKKVFLECSLFFDKISGDLDVIQKCNITRRDFQNLRPNIESFLRYLNNTGFIRSKFFVMNNNNCTFYDVDNQLKICDNFQKSQDKDCIKCKKFWNSFRNNPGKLLSNNLIRREGRKDILLYKTYNCKQNDTFIIGVICQDKY